MEIEKQKIIVYFKKCLNLQIVKFVIIIYNHISLYIILLHIFSLYLPMFKIFVGHIYAILNAFKSRP